MTVGAIILAAGSARRMGADKLMADLGGKPVVAHVLAAVEAAGLPLPIIAVAPGTIVEGGLCVAVPDYALGMGHSIAAAICAVPAGWTAALICLGDMPFVTPATLMALARSAGEGRIVAPVHDGRRGNPLAWGRDLFPALAGLEGDAGGRTVLAGAGEHLISLRVDDPGILIDIDTPEALAAARDRISAPVSTAARGTL